MLIQDIEWLRETKIALSMTLNFKRRSSLQYTIKQELHTYKIQRMVHNDIPKRRKLVGNPWIFKEKCYSQAKGEDFMNNCSPAFHDSDFIIILLPFIFSQTRIAKLWIKDQNAVSMKENSLSTFLR
jgi:hypothetical protein